jgi:hypothetical protein
MTDLVVMLAILASTSVEGMADVPRARCEAMAEVVRWSHLTGGLAKQYWGTGESQANRIVEIRCVAQEAPAS